MLSEFGYPPGLPGCCITSNRCCSAVPSSSTFDGFSFLGSCSGTRERAGITTGAVFSNNSHDGAAPHSRDPEARFVKGSSIGSVMTNLGYTHTAFDERERSEIRREGSREEAMGHAAKENGGWPTAKTAGTTASLKRAFHDRSEAPGRKRIHVCGSDAGAVGVRVSDDVGAKGNTKCAESNPSRQGRDAGVIKHCTHRQLEPTPEFDDVPLGEDMEITEVAVDGSAGDKAVNSHFPRAEDMSIGASRDAGNLRATEVDNAISSTPVDLTGIHMPTAASDSARLELRYEGMGNGIASSRGLDSTDDSIRELASEMHERSFLFPTRSIKSSGLGSPACSPGREALHDLASERREDDGGHEENLNKHVEELSSEDEEERSRNGRDPEDVVILEDDDSDDEDGHSGDNIQGINGRLDVGTEPVGRTPVLQNGIKLSSSRNASKFVSADAESDSDDCLIIGEMKPNQDAPRPQERNRADSEVRYDDEDDSDSEEERSDPEQSDSSDVEVAGGPQSDIQRIWEEAALRRRMGRTMKSAGSKVNGERYTTTDLDVGEGAKSEGLAESVATSAFRDSPESTAESSEARGGAERLVNLKEGRGGANLATEAEARVPWNLNLNEQINPSAAEAEDLNDSLPHVMTTDEEQTAMHNSEARHANSDHEEPLHEPHEEERVPLGNEEARQQRAGSGPDVDDGGLIAMKERLKQTSEFRQADEQEWASRQRELLRQQQEAQRLRKLRQRERLDADRKLEMERKQKQRVQELRLNQMKAEKDMDEKEQIRGRVRDTLEYQASRCPDVASLLRTLGIKVEGGNNPSEAQVNAAFKRALVKFHPDRVGDGDVRRLVEAEETFKLINRMKK
ncbi:hypothetical protein R1sor_011995 [Riccia sorocarpa]|uniref:J domain-containing protein n=1 Tax=Riccia sorocarpa TaxID=122646 RepID=A0ABD3I5W2_9MARC